MVQVQCKCSGKTCVYGSRTVTGRGDAGDIEAAFGNTLVQNMQPHCRCAALCEPVRHVLPETQLRQEKVRLVRQYAWLNLLHSLLKLCDCCHVCRLHTRMLVTDGI